MVNYNKVIDTSNHYCNFNFFLNLKGIIMIFIVSSLCLVINNCLPRNEVKTRSVEQ